MDCDTSTVVPVTHTKASNHTDNVVKPTVRNQQSSDSMVTVRLSDPEPEVSIHNEITEEEALEEFSEMGDEEDFAAKTDNQIVYEHQAPMSPEEAKVVQRIHRDSVTSIQRESVLSMLSAVEEGGSDAASRTIRSRSDSSGTYSSNGSAHVDWDELDKSEEQAPRDEGSDESTAFLLARLEQENNALAIDPKAAHSKDSRNRTKSRPPSMQYLKKLVNEPTKPSLRYSLTQNTPQMTELEFWAALVVDYAQTAQRLPTLTSNKIRSGIPPPLRGVVWISIAGARERLLEDEYERLCGETSPYEGLIGKDIGRSFPNVEMFREPAGEGQQMLARVLKCFSLYDEKIGYCQGLGFVVGPLLMHMGDKEAFCVLVRLMEHYDLRSCFLPNLSGLHLRIFQFQQLLSRHLPRLTAHLEGLQIEPLYVSQWFLSFFAVTCPLPMLLRIYDVILTEGASETLMRVALSLMRRNKDKILKCTEIEDVMQLLLSRELWDTYGCNADDLVNDFVGLTGLVTRESLDSLERTFKESQAEDLASKAESLPGLQAAASRFLGRFWSGSAGNAKVTSAGLTSPGANLSVSGPSRPTSFLRRTPSKQSMASTLNSIESSESQLSAASTEATAMSRSPSDCALPKSVMTSRDKEPQVAGLRNKDKDLHSQIEDLLTALSDIQRDQALLGSELQKEREDRDEDRAVVRRFVEQSQQIQNIQQKPDATAEDQAQPFPSSADDSDTDWYTPMRELTEHFDVAKAKRSSINQTKQELQEDINLWKYQYEVETVKSAELLRQLTAQEAENVRLIEQFRDSRARMQEALQDKQRMEQRIQDMKARRGSMPEGPAEISAPADTSEVRTSTHSGLRELRLGRGDALRLSQPSPAFSKRASSLNMQAVLATDNHKPAAEEALLLELVNAKTSEAVARQELEEVKGKLDSLRRMLGVNTSPSAVSGHRPSPSEPCIVKSASLASSASSRIPAQGSARETPPSSTTGGFFSGWGRRMPSNPVAVAGQGASMAGCCEDGDALTISRFPFMGVGAWCLPAVEGEALIAAQRCRSKHALGDPIRTQLMLNTARLKAMNHDNEIWIMVGFGTHHFVKSSAKSDWVLVLQPSDDPRDGLSEYWWLDAAMLAFNFFLVLFGFPESKWQGIRPEELQMMQSETTSGFLSVKKIVDTTVERAESEKVATLLGLTQSQTARLDPWLHKGKASKQQFKFLSAQQAPAYVITKIVGNFVVAFGCQQSWDRKVIVIIEYGFAGLRTAALPVEASTYAVDS